MFPSLLRSSTAGPSRLVPPQLARSNVAIQALRPSLPREVPSVDTPTTIRSFSSTSPAGDKLKSHSGTKKRFSRTASGLFKRAQAGKQHLNTLFSASRINRLGKTAYTTKTQNTMLRKLLPYA